jgi:hypothetical protein
MQLTVIRMPDRTGIYGCRAGRERRSANITIMATTTITTTRMNTTATTATAITAIRTGL